MKRLRLSRRVPVLWHVLVFSLCYVTLAVFMPPAPKKKSRASPASWQPRLEEVSYRLDGGEEEGEEKNFGMGMTLENTEPVVYSQPSMLLSFAYQVRPGDTIGDLSRQFGLNQDTLLSLNGIKNSRLLQIGQILWVPNQDGIRYQVKKGDTLESIAGKYEVEAASIKAANELFADEVKVNTSLFIPGARLDLTDLQEINGDLFIWPVRGYITSPFGYRPSPFTGSRQFHTGLDIGAPEGTPIRAGMAGRVTSVGSNAVLGNYVVLTHHSGYRTLYAHMSVIRVSTGTYVQTGERIGNVGSTGQSTGPHLHFTVYKNGVLVNPRLLM